MLFTVSFYMIDETLLKNSKAKYINQRFFVNQNLSETYLYQNFLKQKKFLWAQQLFCRNSGFVLLFER